MLNIFTLANGRLFQEEIESLEELSKFQPIWVPAWMGSARVRWVIRRTTLWIAWLVMLCAAFALFSKILPWFVQANLAWIVLFLPIHLALAITMQRASRPLALDSS